MSFPSVLFYLEGDYIHDKIPMGKDHIDFYDQFVKQVIGFSSQYGGSYSISYAAANIIGPPSKFPKYGDFSQTFAMRTYGPWWDKAPSRLIDYMPQNNTDVVSHDYIEVQFYKDVYPIRVSIYEVYNPGSLIRIWAQDCKLKWILLWSGSPQIVPSTSRIFSPPLRMCDFKTSVIRLEFNHSSSNYYTEIDTIQLVGTSELILPKDQSHKGNMSNLLKSINSTNSKYFCHEDICNLTPSREDAYTDMKYLKQTLNEHCIMYKSDMVANFHKSKLISQLGPLFYYVPPLKERFNSMQHFLTEDLTNFMKDKLSSDEDSKKPAHCRFSTLPDEIIIKILKNLDLKSLCRMCRVNKHFNNLAQDPMLYTRLNLKPYWYIINTEALNYLSFRCKYLQKLDLSWCSNLFISDIEKFLDICGSLLTHLRLNSCSCTNDFIMLKISKICKNLKELGLRNCELITDKGFSYLESLEFLERLDLYRTHIRTQNLCKILRRNRRMRHLHLGNTDKCLNIDEVAIELRNSCPDLESIDLWKARTLTSQGIDAFADCKNLREVDFGWCGSTTGYGDSFRRLLFSCERLEKIFLASFRELTEHDLRALTMCKNLKQLDLLGTLSLTNEICSVFFINCPKLEFIDLSFCENVTDCSIQRWQQIYKNVTIKRIKYN